MRTAANLHDALALAGHTTVNGVAIVDATVNQAGWPTSGFVSTVAAGLVRLDFDAAATTPQKDAAVTFTLAFDWSDAAQADAERLAYRDPAIGSILRRGELETLIRAFVSVALDELNALRGQMVGVAGLVWDPANMANATGVTSPNITVTGAAFLDAVDVAAPYSLAGIVATGYVSAANTVNIRLHNGTGAAVNLASGTWGVAVRRPTALPARTLAQLRTAMTAKINAGTEDGV